MKLKILFDYLFALLLLPVCLPVIFILILIASIDTGEFGLFRQIRIGKNAKPFYIYKIRTMKGENESSVTSNKTHSITKTGNFIRNSKLDELPQLFNILLGQMSFVGPRPDVPGYADLLQDEDRVILSVKPGITGPAQLVFREEENILEKQENPLQYNDEVLWPEKVKINKTYIQNWSFCTDLKYIIQ
ncbi:MAG: sugar transferase, partial [Weeksellaceae bacterium]|nr:sugar transferase [Weeksellaceae bacterium]